MKLIINRKSKNYVDALFEKFKINNINDIYSAVGQIIKQSQEWETIFRELCRLHKLKIENLETKTLNKMNTKLFESGLITESDYQKLSDVIDLRNIVNHEYFKYENWSYPLEDVQENLNTIFYMICDGIDFINNKIDKIKGINFGERRTLLDTDEVMFLKK